MRKPSRTEFALLALDGVFLAIFIHELLKAAQAVACGTPGSPADCYPWGAEGPVAGYWSYESKSNYLTDLIAKIGILVLAMSLPFYSGKRAVNIAALALIIPAILGFTWFMFLVA